jgi:hypothetical protein
LAPFLAEAAAVVDQTILQQQQLQQQPSSSSSSSNMYTTMEEQQLQSQSQQQLLWFGSFAVLTSIGMALAGTCLVLAASFKLANLGTYLPFSVLCGFFSAVGVLLWALAFSVDTSGLTWKVVFGSGDAQLIRNSLCHHVPSLVIGILMNRLGPKNPFFVMGLILLTIVIFYAILWLTNVSLEEAQEQHWLWSYEELASPAVQANQKDTSNLLFPSWALPPTPFGTWTSIMDHYVCWEAVWAGLHNMVALAFLYLLRSSIHASALKKNVNNLVRRIPIQQQPQSKLSTTQQRTMHNEEEEEEDNHNDNNDDDTTDVQTMNQHHHYNQGTPQINGEEEEDDDENEENDEEENDNNGDNDDRTQIAATATAADYIQSTRAYQLVQSVRDQVTIVHLSLAEKSALHGQNLARSQHQHQLRPQQYPTMRSSNASSLAVHGGPPDADPKQRTHSKSQQNDYIEIRAKPSQKDLEEIFIEYGYALFVVAFTGGVGCCPTVATSNTMVRVIISGCFGLFRSLTAWHTVEKEICFSKKSSPHHHHHHHPLPHSFHLRVFVFFILFYPYIHGSTQLELVTRLHNTGPYFCCLFSTLPILN